MDEKYYTHATWQVKAGQNDAFIRAWKEQLGAAVHNMGIKGQGTLIESLDDPQLFYSFGAWTSQDEMQRVRSDPGFRAAIARLNELCDAATPGPYKVVATVS